jgi:hypothetical protein
MPPEDAESAKADTDSTRPDTAGIFSAGANRDAKLFVAPAGARSGADATSFRGMRLAVTVGASSWPSSYGRPAGIGTVR